MQLFPRSANTIARLSLVALVLAIPAFVGLWALYNQSSVSTHEGAIIEQPIAFSHQIHAGRLGLDCRYCHTTTQTAAFAGMPSTEQCMTCHSQIARGLPDISALAASQQNGVPVVWQRVYNLPDYTYFDHSAHVNNGVACETCHGRVDQMSIVYQAAPLTMQWCVGCHRAPAEQLRPQAGVFTMGWHPDLIDSGSDETTGDVLVSQYGISTQHLTDCDVCHR